jgi:hypothetical protein
MGFLEAIHVPDYESHQNILYKCSSKIILVVTEAGNWIGDVVHMDHIVHVGNCLSNETNLHACIVSLLPAHSTGTRKQFLGKKYMENERDVTGEQKVVAVASS